MHVSYLRQFEIDNVYKKDDSLNYAIYDSLYLYRGKKSLVLASQKKKDISISRSSSIVSISSLLVTNKNVTDILTDIDYSYLVKKLALKFLFKEIFEYKTMALRIFSVKPIVGFLGFRNLKKVVIKGKNWETGYVSFLLGQPFFLPLLSSTFMCIPLPYKIYRRYSNLKFFLRSLFLFFDNFYAFNTFLISLKSKNILGKSFLLSSLLVSSLVQRTRQFAAYCDNASFYRHKFTAGKRFFFIFNALKHLSCRYSYAISQNWLVSSNLYLLSKLCTFNKIRKFYLFKFIYKSVYAYNLFFKINLAVFRFSRHNSLFGVIFNKFLQFSSFSFNKFEIFFFRALNNIRYSNNFLKKKLLVSKDVSFSSYVLLKNFFLVELDIIPNNLWKFVRYWRYVYFRIVRCVFSLIKIKRFGLSKIIKHVLLPKCLMLRYKRRPFINLNQKRRQFYVRFIKRLKKNGGQIEYSVEKKNFSPNFDKRYNRFQHYSSFGRNKKFLQNYKNFKHASIR